MANSAQAFKRARQAKKQALLNQGQKSEARTAIKQTLKALDGTNGGNKDIEAAKAAYKKAVVLLDKLAKHNVIHQNKAARLKSRLNKRIHAATT